MNDRYLFRGKRIDDGKWLEGNVIFGAIYMEGQHVHIVNPGTVGIQAYPTSKLNQIDPATLGQCTGLKDKNGRLIFEGDVVKWVNSHDDEQIDTVKWLSGGLCLRNSKNTVGNYVYSGLEIIGNVHDDPELLKGEG